jgi:hypothetical protein
VPLGNIPFWGNYNMLATLSDPTNGLVAHFGPFYYFDLLTPLSIFAAFGLVAGWRLARESRAVDRLTARMSDPTARRLGLVALVVCGLAVGGTNAVLLAEPFEENIEPTQKFEVAYEPIEDTEFDNALVFIPDPYGPWQNHPFQPLRNEPGFDGEVVYALDRGIDDRFAVLDFYPNRTLYRYGYQGEWTPNPDQYVAPKLEALTTNEGESFAAQTVVGVPDRVSSVRVRLENNGEYASYSLTDPGSQITANWTLAPGEARLADMDDRTATTAATESTVPLAETDEVVVLITLIQPDGSTFTYRQEVAVRSTSERVEVVWPPDRTVCPLVTDCGSEGTYLPNNPDAHSEWVDFETRLGG